MLDVDVEQGVSVVDRMPGFTDGVDYANLNNLARVNSGLASKYDATALAGYALNDPNNLRYPNVNWRDLTLKDTKSYTRVNVSSSGGNEVIQYYSSIGYAGEGDIYKIGSTSDYNRINARQNVTVKINDQINVKFTFYGNMSYRRSPNYGYSSNFTSEDSGSNPPLGLTEFPYSSNGTSGSPGSYGAFNDINLAPPIAFPLYAHRDSVNTWYGVSSAYAQNPVGGLVGQGYYTDQSRTGASNLTLNYDLGNIVKGLKASGTLGFNIHDMVRIGKANDYAAYTSSISAKTGNDTIIKASTHALVNQSDNAKLLDYYLQRYTFFGQLNYDRTFGDHTLQANLTYNQVKAFINGVEEPTRDQSYIFSGMYSYKDKYSVQAVLNYAGTTSFSASKRYALFPSIGANWVISEENFMSNLKFINYLKLRAQYGVNGNETYFPVLYYVDRWSQNTSGSAFGPYSSLTWFGTTQDGSVPRNNPQRIGNPNLTWEKRREFNTGFDALFLNQKLGLDFSYYNYINDGTIVQVSNQMPYTVGLNGSRPWYNFTRTQYNMFTVDLHYSDKIGQLEYTVGVNATTQKSKRLKYDEPAYRFDYQKHTGLPADAIFGMVYQGKFATDAETTAVPQLFDATLKAGDLKYADLNGDGFVDDQDQKMIGHSTPRLFYGLNVDLKYKNFELYVMGNGRAFYDIALTNTYFWSGWGDNNYSDFVANNVDPTTGLGTAYPRLTYNKVNNNFITSAYWLTKGDYFKVQNIELSYTIPSKMLQFVGGRAVKIYLRGANLLTISKVKNVDPESINSGVTTYPLYKTFTGGIKFNF
jgi:TonB-linked SusC/RagA family outer membrane protein